MAMVMLAFVSVSCAKKNTDTAVVYSDDVIEINPSDVSIERNHSVKWSDDEGIVLVVFGYGFNDSEFLAEAKKVISSAYGLSENGGLVRCVVFPDDLHNRISNFRQIVDENNVRGIIVFGAPEGCHLTFRYLFYFLFSAFFHFFRRTMFLDRKAHVVLCLIMSLPVV